MKNFLKTLKLMVIMELVVIFVYLFLHEAGHALTALLFGIEILEFKIFPKAYVMCDMSTNNSVIAMIIIGLAGLTFPFIISKILDLFNFKKFHLWYINMSLKYASIFHMLGSLVFAILYLLGNDYTEDDVIMLIDFYPKGTIIYFLMLFSLALVLIIDIIKSKPLERLETYYEI